MLFIRDHFSITPDIIIIVIITPVIESKIHNARYFLKQKISLNLKNPPTFTNSAKLKIPPTFANPHFC